MFSRRGKHCRPKLLAVAGIKGNMTPFRTTSATALISHFMHLDRFAIKQGISSIKDTKRRAHNEIARETIFALATPLGKSAVAVVRLSGPGTKQVCEYLPMCFYNIFL